MATVAPMVWAVSAIAVATGITAGALASPLLRRAPEPALEADETKTPYRALAGPRSALAAFCWATICAGIAVMLVPLPRTAPWLVLALVGSLAAVVDIATTWIPRRWLQVGWALMAAAVSLSALASSDWPSWVRSAVGSLVTGGLFWLVYEIAARRGRAPFGFADVRLGFLTGAVSGWHSWTLVGWSLLLGSVLGALWGIVVAVRRGRDGPFPYGPSIVAGPYLALGLWAFLP